MQITIHQKQEMQRERSSLVDSMKSIVKKAERENRNLTDAESEEYNQKEVEIQVLDKLINSYIPDSTHKPLVTSGSRNDLPQVDYVEALQSAVKNNGAFTGQAREVSNELQSRTGLAVKGALMPFSAFRPSGAHGYRNAMTAGTPAEGGYLVPTVIDSPIDYLREKSFLAKAGAITLENLSGNLSIPKKTSKTTAEWLAEGADGNREDITFGQVAMSPNRCQVYYEPTKQLVMQSSTSVQDLLKMDALDAINGAVEAAAINGSGSGAEPLGIIGTSGVTLNGAGETEPTYVQLVSLESSISSQNADIGKLSYVTNTAVRGFFKKTKLDDGSGLFIWGRDNTLNGYPAIATNHVPADMDSGAEVGNCSAVIFGNWADLVIGYWGFADVVVDPYTLATSGKMRIVITVYVDIAVRHPESFAVLTGIKLGA